MTFLAKQISFLLVLISIFTLTALLPGRTRAAVPAKPATHMPATGIGDTFAGEVLVYDLGFWIFRKIATGKFTITREEDGTYKAVLDASSKTRLLRSTRSTFTAYIKESADKKRFITIRFEKYSKKGKTVKRIIKELDHENGILKITKVKNGEFQSLEEIDIPEGATYDDPLAAFYNLRFGVYGPMEKGGEHLITTFPEKGKEVRIATRVASEKELKKGVRRWKNNAWILLKAKLDKELFDSSSGDIDLFFDAQMVTLNVVAKDVLLFGDIYAKLNREKSFSPNAPIVPAPPSLDDLETDSWDEEYI